VCNILGGFALGYDNHIAHYKPSNGTMGHITHSDGRQMAYFQPDRDLFVLQVSAPLEEQLGPPVIVKSKRYRLKYEWDSSEQERWMEYCDSLAEPSDPDAEDFYTAEEKAFLESGFLGERLFFRRYGLNPDKEADRRQGRVILRQLIKDSER
jgi:hypothetical protein